MGIILGLLGLLLLLSFSSFNACQLANSNIVSIKIQTQKAIEVNSLEMTKYHTFKALNGLEKTKTNLNNCGCEPALNSMVKMEENLKKATKAKSKKMSTEFLKLALASTQFTLEVLNEFNNESESSYGDDLLVMNTKNSLKEQGGVLLTPAKQMEVTMNKSLTEFEVSLENVVKHVECADAFNFINKILSKSERHLQEKTLTVGQREYHTRVKSIAHNALVKLNGCPVK